MFLIHKNNILILAMCGSLSVFATDELDKSQPSTRNEQLIHLIAGTSSDKSYEPRAAAVHKLNDYLTSSEISLIKSFLYQKQMDLTNLEFNSIKNDLVVILMRQKKPIPELGEWLIDMFADKTFGDTWRDYCIQFIGQLYPDSSPENKKKMITVLTGALKEKSNGIAGAALIALNRNSSDALVNRSELGKAACAIAVNAETPEYLKVTAIQIAALHGESEILLLCDKIIDSGNSSFSTQLKMSAIAAVGILKSEERIAKIRPFEKSSDIRLASAAKSAINKIENKNGAHAK